VLVVVGERDIIFSARQMAGRVIDVGPYAAVRILPNAGHALLSTAGSVTAFLRSDKPSHRRMRWLALLAAAGDDVLATDPGRLPPSTVEEGERAQVRRRR
jgi:hypothetical protein